MHFFTLLIEMIEQRTKDLKIYTYTYIFFFLDHDDDKENSGSEYVPSEDEQHLLEDNVLPQKRSPILSTSITSISSLDATQINNGAPICNDETMQIEASNK